MSLKKLRKRVAEAECSITPMYAELKELRFKKQVAQLDIQLVKGYIALKRREPTPEAHSAKIDYSKSKPGVPMRPPSQLVFPSPAPAPIARAPATTAGTPRPFHDASHQRRYSSGLAVEAPQLIADPAAIAAARRQAARPVPAQAPTPASVATTPAIVR